MKDKQTISWAEIPRNAERYGINKDELAKVIRLVGNKRSDVESMLNNKGFRDLLTTNPIDTLLLNLINISKSGDK